MFITLLILAAYSLKEGACGDPQCLGMTALIAHRKCIKEPPLPTMKVHPNFVNVVQKQKPDWLNLAKCGIIVFFKLHT